MKPIDFPQSSKVLQRPEDMLDTDCKPLPIWSDGMECVSCWKPTFKERLRILMHGKVWLAVLSGKTQPPVFITGEEFFVQPPFRARVRFFFEDMWDDIVSLAKEVRNAAKEKDKVLHFVCGFVIAYIIGIFIPLLGLAIGCIAGLLKEFWDSKGHGTVEIMDAIFTCFGASIALPFAWLTHHLIF